jgi:predicted nucleic acid-binding protein
MSDKIFLDTNILIYAIETKGNDPNKSQIAQTLLKLHNIVLSTQVLGEFYHATTSPKRTSPLTHEEAIVWIQLWKRYDLQTITAVHVDLALELKNRFQIGYYDALILSSGRLAKCKHVFSEDLSDGQDYGGISVINPFV